MQFKQRKREKEGEREREEANNIANKKIIEHLKHSDRMLNFNQIARNHIKGILHLFLLFRLLSHLPNTAACDVD